MPKPKLIVIKRGRGELVGVIEKESFYIFCFSNNMKLQLDKKKINSLKVLVDVLYDMINYPILMKNGKVKEP
jgi:hypothetical protein